MKEYYVTLTGTGGYFGDIVKANTEEEAIEMVTKKFAKVVKKIKKVFVKEA
jgi:hypothetical protein